MKRTAVQFGIAMLNLLANIGGTCEASSNRSNSSLRGSFGYSSTGTLLDSYVPPPFADRTEWQQQRIPYPARPEPWARCPGPFAEVGRQSFDGKGNTAGTATLSSNGNINRVTIQGTYTVNADCTGSMTLFIPDFGATLHADFVIERDGAEIRAIVTEPGVIESRVYRKQFREGHEKEQGIADRCEDYAKRAGCALAAELLRGRRDCTGKAGTLYRQLMMDPVYNSCRVDKPLSAEEREKLSLRVQSDAGRAIEALQLERGLPHRSNRRVEIYFLMHFRGNAKAK